MSDPGSLNCSDRMGRYMKVSTPDELGFFIASHVLPEPPNGASLLGAEDLYDGPVRRLRSGWRPNPTLVKNTQLSAAQRSHGAPQHVCELHPAC